MAPHSTTTSRALAGIPSTPSIPSISLLFETGTRAMGDYDKTTGQVCLLPHTGGRSCFASQQETDAMKLDDAIYNRRQIHHLDKYGRSPPRDRPSHTTPLSQ